MDLHIEKISALLWESYDCAEGDIPCSSCRGLPSRTNTISAVKLLLSAIMPGRFLSSGTELSQAKISSLVTEAVGLLKIEILKILPEPEDAISKLIEKLPQIRQKLIKDIKAAYSGDPAATSYAEVISSYPGILVICFHRIAHQLFKSGVPLIPRLINEWAHSKTGIDIHPGASIGEGFFIDHGTGVVIGETARIGKKVKIYQGVTLGARSFSKDENGALIKGLVRHPVVEDNVVIYANATILGGETVIGKNSVIGSNVFIMESIPPDSLVLSKSMSDSSSSNFRVTNKS